MNRCIDCQNGGNKKGTYICFGIKSLNFTFKEVLNTTTNCEFFEPLIDIGERMDVTYPLDMKNAEKEMRKLPWIKEDYIEKVLKPYRLTNRS